MVSKKINVLRIVLAVALFSLTLFFMNTRAVRVLDVVGVQTGVVHAADPGCYTRADDGSYTPSDCGSVAPASDALGDGKCYSRQLAHPGFTPYVERVCDDINMGSGTEEPQFVKNDCNEATLNETNCGIVKYLKIFINVLSTVVGVVVVASIVYGAIQYSSAGGDPQKVSAAKKRILGAIIALFMFIFMYAFIQYLVPGGIFSE